MTTISRLFFPLILAVAFAAPCQNRPFRVLAGSDVVTAADLQRVETLVEEGLGRLTPIFTGTPTVPFTVHVHAKLSLVPPAIRGLFHKKTAGIAILSRQSIHLILHAARRFPPNDLRTVVDHELVHILLHQYAGKSAPYVPRWFHEGLAQDLSGRTYLGASEDDLVFRVQTGRLMRFRDLREGFPSDATGLRIAYAQSFSFVAFLRGELGMPVLLRVVRQCGPEEWFIEGLARVTNMTLLSLTEPWERYLVTDSGAIMRFLQGHCFAYTMILAVVFLALAGIRRWNRDYEIRLRLEREETETHAAELAEAEAVLEREWDELNLPPLPPSVEGETGRGQP